MVCDLFLLSALNWPANRKTHAHSSIASQCSGLTIFRMIDFLVAQFGVRCLSVCPCRSRFQCGLQMKTQWSMTNYPFICKRSPWWMDGEEGRSGGPILQILNFTINTKRPTEGHQLQNGRTHIVVKKNPLTHADVCVYGAASAQ